MIIDTGLFNKHKEQIKFINTYGIKYLDEWEKGFMDSMNKMVEKQKDTSFDQQKILNKIYEKVSTKIG